MKLDKSALFEQLIQVFLGELDEHVRTQNRDLLELERNPSEVKRTELVRNLLRSAHSLKGAAHAVGLAPIEKLCHSAEELLGEVNAGQRYLDKLAFELLFASVDALDDAGKRLRDGRGLEGSTLAELTERLAQAPRVTEAPRPVVPLMPPPTSDRPLVQRSVNDPAAGHVRVAAQKLDKLLTQAGELVVARSHLDARHQEIETLVETFAQLRAEWQRLERPLAKGLTDEQARLLPLSFRNSFERARVFVDQIEQRLEQLSMNMSMTVRACHGISAEIDAEVKKVRMLPFGDVCTGISRAVRDLAQERGKDVEVVVRGGDVELDRYILEGLKDPLVHLARNAVDHGIELPEVRMAAGKPARGRIEIAAMLRGSQVEITVTDDGAGLDAESIVARARDKGFVSSASAEDATRLIFLPGFSTSVELTLVSGRGVGLDVVKSRVESLHGQVDVESKPGRGVRFALIVPLTVTTVRAAVVDVSGQVFALPSTSVERMMRIAEEDVRWVEGRPMLLHDGALLEIASLAQLLGLPERDRAENRDPHVIVVSGRAHAVGLVVDKLVFADEILVKNLGRRLRRVRYVSGATVLAGGKVALILNPGELVAGWSKFRTARRFALPSRQEPAALPQKRRILVVDDSPTTRTLGRTILEAAGFEVLVAVDGQDALRVLEDRGADLVLSDVEMPRLDGFALTEAIRASRTLSKLPVVLMTGLGGERDKARGLEAGADAYLVKSAFDKDQLLEVISQLL